MKRIDKKNKAIISVFLLTVLFIVFCGVSIYCSKNVLVVSHYILKSEKITNEIKIVQLSDLHNNVFGEDNEKLVRKVSEENPDLIFMTGDMLNNDDNNVRVVTCLISDLATVAPVFVSMGNHEKDYENIYDVDLKMLFEENGANVLDNEWIDVDIKGNKLRIGGIFGYCLPEEIIKNGEGKQEELAFITSMTDTESYTILLAHLPICWIESGSLDSYDVDSVWSGHAHGGQIIFPLLGGLYAPDQGYFLGRVWGVFDSKDGKRHLILSRGLGTNKKIPRMNNIPEIVSVTIKPMN